MKFLKPASKKLKSAVQNTTLLVHLPVTSGKNNAIMQKYNMHLQVLLIFNKINKT